MNADRTRRDVVGTGFAVLDRIYADGEFAIEALGGSCGNVLVSLAMLDRDVAPVLVLGRDDVGRKLVDEFQVAGADVSYIALRADRGSPVLAQELDTATGEHRFSFTCVETRMAFPKYEPIGIEELDLAGRAIEACRVFYADRISNEIVGAMESARLAGALVYFEPSESENDDLFRRAVRAASIVKYSSDRLGARVDSAAATVDVISIVTHGEAGLEMRQGGEVRWCAAIPANRVADTCGAGDMVSVGIIDWILSHLQHVSGMTLADIADGVLAGQRLAAANCAYTGARGVFHEKGASHARRILSET